MSKEELISTSLQLSYIVKEKDEIIEKQKPKVEFYDKIISSETTFDMKEVSGLISEKDFGRTNLFEFLRTKKILGQDNFPYQIYKDKGYFKLAITTYTDRKGNISLNTQTVATPNGIDFVRKLIKKHLEVI